MTPFYNLLIIIGGFIVGIVAFFEEIAAKISALKNLKSLIFKISFFILGSIMVAIGVIGKDSEAEDQQKADKAFYLTEAGKMETNYRSEIKRNDSINSLKIQASIDSSYSKSIKASNEALAKYNLILIDSLQNTTNKINVKATLAQLAVDAHNGSPPIYTTTDADGSKMLNIRIMSANATSYNIRLNLYIFQVIDKEPFLLQYILSPKSDESFLVPDRTRTVAGRLKKDLYNIEKVTIVLLGEFSRDENKEKIIEFKEAHSFNIKENKLVDPELIDYALVKKILTERKIPH